jgi:hypothetical protein
MMKLAGVKQATKPAPSWVKVSIMCRFLCVLQKRRIRKSDKSLNGGDPRGSDT